MKKILTIISVLIIICIFGCENSSKKTEWNEEIKSSFSPTYKIVTTKELRNLFPRHIIDEGLCFFYDGIYKIPYNPKYIMKSVLSYDDYYTYNSKYPNEMDCDKRVRIFRGLLAANYYGNLVAMETNIIMTIDGEVVGHSIISFLDINGERDKHGKCRLIFGDPRTGKLIKKSEYEKYIITELRI